MENTFAERLTTALKLRDITAAELSRKSGVPESVISQYKKGEYLAKQRRLDLFSSILRVSPAWLLGADVPMDGITLNKNTPTAEAAGDIEQKRNDLVNEFANLDEADRSLLLDIAKVLKARHNP